jgi:hypothetical protein
MVSLLIILQNPRTFSITWSFKPQRSDDTDDCRFSAARSSGENMLIVGLQQSGPLRFVVTDDGDTGNLIMQAHEHMSTGFGRTCLHVWWHHGGQSFSVENRQQDNEFRKVTK